MQVIPISLSICILHHRNGTSASSSSLYSRRPSEAGCTPYIRLIQRRGIAYFFCKKLSISISPNSQRLKHEITSPIFLIQALVQVIKSTVHCKFSLIACLHRFFPPLSFLCLEPRKFASALRHKPRQSCSERKSVATQVQHRCFAYLISDISQNRCHIVHIPHSDLILTVYNLTGLQLAIHTA